MHLYLKGKLNSLEKYLLLQMMKKQKQPLKKSATATTPTSSLDSIAEIRKINIRDFMERRGYKIEFDSPNRSKIKCPLHNEKTPSFVIYAESNSYYCFGCHTGGSIIDLVMSLDKLTLPEALNYLKNIL